MGTRYFEILKRAVKAVVKPVLQQWPLWLTMVLTLIPMAWSAWDYHVLRKHDFPVSYLMECLVNDASVVAVLATFVAWLVNVVRCRRVLKWALYVLLLAMWVASLFLLRNFNTTFTPQILQVMMETNSGERRVHSCLDGSLRNPSRYPDCSLYAAMHPSGRMETQTGCRLVDAQGANGSCLSGVVCAAGVGTMELAVFGKTLSYGL